MKYFYIDLETTGTNEERHGIIKMGVIIEIDDEIKEEFQLKIQPFPTDVIDKKSLEINGITLEELKTYQDPTEAYQHIIKTMSKYVDRYDKTDKFHLVGYNSTNFDYDFLRQFFIKNNDEYIGSWFWWPGIDVSVILGELLKEVRHKLLNFKLATICEHLGIEIKNYHDALSDVRATRQLYKLICENLYESK